MITLKEYFSDKDTEGLDIDFLLKLYEGVNVFVTRLIYQVKGVANHKVIYLNIDNKDPKFFYYVALHELAHHRRMQKNGLEYHLNKLSSTDFIEFSEHVIYEEIIADRYALRLFKQANGYKPSYSQQLDIIQEQESFKERLRGYMFGKFENDVEKYDKLIEGYLI